MGLLEEDWVKGSKVKLVVDCEPLAGMMNGMVPVQNRNYSPIAERTINHLCGILESNVSFTNSAEPVQWRPRHMNQIADKLANETMDGGFDMDWKACQRASWINKSIVVLSDGRFRSISEKAAAAWIVVELKETVRETKMIAKASKLVDKCVFLLYG